MLRSLARNWKLNGIAVFSLVIAMALSVVALSFTNAMLLRPPVAREPERLVNIFAIARNGEKENFSYPDYEYIRNHARGFAGIGAFHYGFSATDATFDERQDMVFVNSVSDNYFDVMGISPFLGRFFTLGDDRKRAPAAVLTYACWRRWGADSNVIGKTLRLGNRTLTILGVAPKSFLAPVFGVGADVIVNLGAASNYPPEWLEQRNRRLVLLVGRLNRETTRAQARAEIATMWQQIGAAYPDKERDIATDVSEATILHPSDVRTARITSAVLIAAVLLILLVACANTANLLLAMATQRRQEALIKTALGASRARLIREFLSETFVLCGISGAIGFALAAAVLKELARFDLTVPVIGSVQIAIDLHPNAFVIALTLLLILLTTLTTGLTPALYVSKPNLASALSEEIVIGGTRRGVIRNAVVVIQVAVCTLVLVGTGICMRSLHNLRSVDPGFSARNIVASFLSYDSLGLSKDQRLKLYDDLRRGAEQLYGVESATVADGLPLGGESSDREEIRFTDRPPGEQKIFIDLSVGDENYFSTLGIKLLEGRPFNASDHDAIVINHFMAEKFWPRRSAVGRTIGIGGEKRPATIVGVAADGKYDNFDEAPRPYMYLPLAQRYQDGVMLIARTKGDPKLWKQPLARMIRGLGVKVPVPPVTLENWINLTLFVPIFVLGCVAGLSALGILLATVGLYGAISYSVGERRKELGIRIALGARPGQVMGMVFRETLWVSGGGVLAGLALGVAATMIFRSQLYGIQPVEWRVLAPVMIGMVALSLGTAYLAARRWTRMNPMDAVRHA